VLQWFFGRDKSPVLDAGAEDSPEIGSMGLDLKVSNRTVLVDIRGWEGRSGTVALYDVSGRSVASLSIEANHSSSSRLTAPSAGIYFVEAKVGGGARLLRRVAVF
jgi:hypothetical protein